MEESAQTIPVVKFRENPDKKAAFEAAVAKLPQKALKIALKDNSSGAIRTWDEWITASERSDPYSGGVARAAERLAQLLQGEYLTAEAEAEEDKIPEERLRHLESLANTDGLSGSAVWGVIHNLRYFTIVGERVYGPLPEKRSGSLTRLRAIARRAFLLGHRE